MERIDPTSPAIIAILASRPPTTDPITYLTIIESHLSPAILPTLHEILQDAALTQDIGWDLIHLLLPIPGSQACLETVARLGNPREVVLKITEALALLGADGTEDEDADESEEEEDGMEHRNPGVTKPPPRVSSEEIMAGIQSRPTDDTHNPPPATNKAQEPQTPSPTHSTSDEISQLSSTDKFCTLLTLLTLVHPRIKTKYPSRFLSASLVAILSAYRPTPQATHAICIFVHSISGASGIAKRPALPQRQSSISGSPHLSRACTHSSAVVPDPEAEVAPKMEPPGAPDSSLEKSIQVRLLQAFLTHVLEEFVRHNGLHWSARLREHFKPESVLPTRKSWAQRCRDEEELRERDICLGQLVAQARDLGLSDTQILWDCMESEETSPDAKDEVDEETSPSSPEDIPLSKAGCLYLMTTFMTSAVLFSSSTSAADLFIFPDHANLTKHFLGISGPPSIGTEEASTIDAVLAIGIYLEASNKFVRGPLDDDDFLQHLQMLSLLSANTPHPALRYSAHVLCASILHAHPDDRVRLTFIADVLEHCPFDNLKVSAVGWLKEELMRAAARSSDDLFATPVALSATQPFLFPDLRTLADAPLEEIWQDFQVRFPLHMAVLNLLVFLGGSGYPTIVPAGMLNGVEEYYVMPMRKIAEMLEKALAVDGELGMALRDDEAQTASREVQLLGERLTVCLP